MYNTDMLISVVAVAMNDGNESNSTESGISMIGSVVATSDVVVFDDAVVASEVVDVDVEVNGVGSGIVAVAVRMGVVMLSVGAADEAAVGGVGGVAVGGSVVFVEFVVVVVVVFVAVVAAVAVQSVWLSLWLQSL